MAAVGTRAATVAKTEAKPFDSRSAGLKLTCHPMSGSCSDRSRSKIGRTLPAGGSEARNGGANEILLGNLSHENRRRYCRRDKSRHSVDDVRAKRPLPHIRIALTAYEGTPTLSIWVWFRTPSGNLRPGKGGLVVGLRHLPALAEALALALATARANGRLPLDSPSEALGAP